MKLIEGAMMRFINTLFIMIVMTLLLSPLYGQEKGEELKLGWHKKMVGSLNFT